MKRLVDIVNFNADGSCLSAARWLAALQGGRDSELCSWLRGYVLTDSKVSLGFIGATIADIVALNNEAIDIINEHPALFEVLVRPFAHDIALLRGDFGFRLNLEYGRKANHQAFREPSAWYLPPEFMLTNRQLAVLPEFGFGGVFINPGRFEREVQGRLPRQPYIVTGVSGVAMPCIPFDSGLTEAYLRTIQRLSAAIWTDGCKTVENDIAYVWRDGESAFLLPHAAERERFWLEAVNATSERVSLKQAVGETRFLQPNELPLEAYRSYPVHSFAAWMKEFRMLGYLRAVERFEDRLESMTVEQRLIWLEAINSDVLSAVEKASPTVLLKGYSKEALPDGHFDHQILRTERGFEGEEYLHLLERIESGEVRRHINESDSPHMIKLRARLGFGGATGV